ncbi:replication-relaxation family protein [Nocardiopsis composta]|uniref:Protein involved in plasmid replication-relaxation n=1 Tax=Nocardiopsis composta TaxID=157465 RepID=A0A7W8QSP7_9ACTN|nr:replication-relaxation family protein [Nocardiopsis composta]MBB5435198.1 hypothetical protein [Nocardiopsis composta]
MSTTTDDETITRRGELARLLTDRDRAVIASLGDHRVMTTHHLAALHFHDVASQQARRRLLGLHRRGVLDRFRPHLPRGGAPWHWVLGADGEHIYADIHAMDKPAQRPGSRILIAHSAKLGHALGLAGCHVEFVKAARSSGARLLRWRTEADCARRWGAHIRPDAYLRWAETEHAPVLEAFLEYDNGTEPHFRVARKLRGYTDHAAAHARTDHVLFVVPTAARESGLARALASHTTPAVTVHLTTTALLHAPGPAAAIWRPAHDTGRLTPGDIAT